MDHPVVAEEKGIWAIYVEESEKYDKRLVEAWKEGMDSTLIFAGLFSAIVTNFIIDVQQSLQIDTSAASLKVLNQISQQLAAANNGSRTPIPALTINPLEKPPDAGAAFRATLLFVMSLVFSLAGALAAILVKQWTTTYLNATQRRPSPARRARIRSYLYAGIKYFRLSALVNAIPTLLHISLFLFFGGLFNLFWPLDRTIAYICIAAMSICAGLYLFSACIAAIFSNCPYQIPLSTVLWHVVRLFRLLHNRRHPDTQEVVPDTRIHEVELLAMDKHICHSWRPSSAPSVRMRDFDGLRWTLQSLTDNEELEPFVAGIPNLLASQDTMDPHGLLRDLIKDEGVALGKRLLTLCQSAEQLRSPHRRQQRVASCITALWALVCSDIEQLNEPNSNAGPGFMFESFDDFAPILRKWLRDDVGQIANLANYTLLLLCCKVLSVHAGAQHIQLRKIKPILWALRDVQQTNPYLANCSIKEMWPAVQDAQLGALNLLLASLLAGAPLPNFIYPPHRRTAQGGIPAQGNDTAPGSIAFYVIRNLTCEKKLEVYQREFVQILRAMMEELRQKPEGRLNRQMLEDMIPLLTTVTDPEAFEDAKALIQAIPRSPTFDPRNYLETMGKRQALRAQSETRAPVIFSPTLTGRSSALHPKDATGDGGNDGT